ncbi:hypothetical protein BJY04DRAFT_219733 [Aspergillus karnatakaensis]|uniref:uncharacterized protein n=1 Tax=Aspergillus karnatakaensis TaxID=1810916 RepID=UPI003CCE0DB7
MKFVKDCEALDRASKGQLRTHVTVWREGAFKSKEIDSHNAYAFDTRFQYFIKVDEGGLKNIKDEWDDSPMRTGIGYVNIILANWGQRKRSILKIIMKRLRVHGL